MKITCQERMIERRVGESFMIGDVIEVFVESLGRGRVRLLCRAPGALSLLPRELVEELAAENRRAALSRVPETDELFLALEEEKGTSP